MSLRLSFIIPFYNVEPYIEECIRSLYAQDVPRDDYEVICVDDCSLDGSRTIVARLQKEYPTLHLLTTPENLRQGGARNLALNIAQGKYIWFVDSDDYIKPNCLGNLLKIAEEECLDILDFDFASDFQSNISNDSDQNFYIRPCTGTEYVFNTKYDTHWSSRCSGVCYSIIRLELIRNLRFQEKVQYEDTDYAMEMYAMAKRVMHIPSKVYHHRYRINSTTHSRIIQKSTLYYRVELIKRYINLFYKLEDKRWQSALTEIIECECTELISILENTSIKNKLYFYSRRLGYINNLDVFIEDKNRLVLKSYIVLIINKFRKCLKKIY